MNKYQKSNSYWSLAFALKLIDVKLLATNDGCQVRESCFRRALHQRAISFGSGFVNVNHLISLIAATKTSRQRCCINCSFNVNLHRTVCFKTTKDLGNK